MMRFEADRVHASGVPPELHISAIAEALDWREHPRDSMHKDVLGLSLARHPDGAVRIRVWDDDGEAVWIVRPSSVGQDIGPAREPNYSLQTATTKAKVWRKRRTVPTPRTEEHETGDTEH